MAELSPSSGWACTVCGARHQEFAPSGRCLACEQGALAVREERPPLMQIGALVEAVGLSLRTIRHYEDVGVLLPAGRTAGGFRLYDEDAVERLRLIMKMKPLGFSLEEMRQLIEARAALAADPPPEQRESLLALVESFSVAAEEKVQQLRATIDAANAFAESLDADTHSARG